MNDFSNAKPVRDVEMVIGRDRATGEMLLGLRHPEVDGWIVFDAAAARQMGSEIMACRELWAHNSGPIKPWATDS